MTDARKVKLGADDALALVRDSRELYVARGKKLLHFRLDDDSVNEEELLGVLLGRSGTLRAPAIRVGEQMVVGFHTDAYTKVLDI